MIKNVFKRFCTNELKDKLIKLSMLNISKYGWTENSIKLAANELNYSHNLSALMENGPIDLVYYTIDNWNKKLEDEIENIRSNEKYMEINLV
jgi:ubiquinone biosynthesis protein COQ9